MTILQGEKQKVFDTCSQANGAEEPISIVIGNETLVKFIGKLIIVYGGDHFIELKALNKNLLIAERKWSYLIPLFKQISALIVFVGNPS
ncbi:hypothetical protein LHA01_25250 [Schleiferilactobacillus harbinensis]|nr:hypothetical protein LHA01_25250 [Schleiferilactobacillus harbinensis]